MATEIQQVHARDYFKKDRDQFRDPFLMSGDVRRSLGSWESTPITRNSHYKTPWYYIRDFSVLMSTPNFGSTSWA